MAKTRHKSQRTVMRYVKAVAEVTSLPGPAPAHSLNQSAADHSGLYLAR